MFVDSVDVLKNVFRNCLDVSVESRRVYLTRFTEQQLEFYRTDPLWAQRTGLAAGICLDFCTDSPFIKLAYEITYKDRDWFCFDFLVNGQFVECRGERPVKSLRSALQFMVESPCRRLNRVTLYLPQTIGLTLSNLELADGSRIELAPAYQGNFLCAGDSIFQGMDCIHPFASCAVQISRFLNMNLLNQSVGGLIFSRRTLDEEIHCRPDIILVAYGTNDWTKAESLDDFETRTREYFEKLEEIYPHAKTLAVTPLRRKDEELRYNVGPLAQIREAISRICRDFASISVVDGLSLVPHPFSFFDERGVHPSDEGHLYMALNLLKQIHGEDT